MRFWVLAIDTIDHCIYNQTDIGSLEDKMHIQIDIFQLQMFFFFKSIFDTARLTAIFVQNFQATTVSSRPCLSP